MVDLACLGLPCSQPGCGMILLALNQSVTLALYFVAKSFHLLDGEGLTLHPLSHVLLLHLNDVVSDRRASVRLWWVPNQIRMVGAPVDNVWFTAWVRLVPRIFSKNVVSLHFTWI